jgi:hypothetical protein
MPIPTTPDCKHDSHTPEQVSTCHTVSCSKGFLTNFERTIASRLKKVFRMQSLLCITLHCSTCSSQPGV